MRVHRCNCGMLGKSADGRVTTPFPCVRLDYGDDPCCRRWVGCKRQGAACPSGGSVTSAGQVSALCKAYLAGRPAARGDCRAETSDRYPPFGAALGAVDFDRRSAQIWSVCAACLLRVIRRYIHSSRSLTGMSQHSYHWCHKAFKNVKYATSAVSLLNAN